MRIRAIIVILALVLPLPVVAATCVTGLQYWATIGTPVDGRSVTSHVMEMYADCGLWTPVDVAVTSNADGSYKEGLLGFGRILVKTPRFSFSQSAFAGAAFGSNANGELYLIPASSLKFTGSETFPGEIALFVYLPLNSAGQAQFILDRAKIERTLGTSWKAGVGLSAYWSETVAWENRPFVTISRSTSLGSIEARGEFLNARTSGRGFQVGLRLVH